MSTFHTRIDSPIGPLVILSSEAGVMSTRRSAEGPTGDPHDAAKAYAAWFDGDLAALATLPLDLRGTPFQRDVWAALRALPVGSSTTYGQLAAQLGKPPGAAQAIGGAVGANPVVVAVPCHRVLGSDGGLTGFAWGLPAKRWLLQHEGHAVPAEQLGLF